MKRLMRMCVLSFFVWLFGVCLLSGKVVAYAAGEEDVIASGVYIGDIDVSGMTKEEAKQAVEAYMQQMSQSSIQFVIGENVVEVSIGELGMAIQSDDIYEEAVGLGKKGNVVKRYKDSKCLAKEGMHYKLSYTFDEQAVRNLLEERCHAFDKPAVNAGLRRTGNGFEVTAGEVGQQLDVEQSVSRVMDFLNHEWNLNNTQVALAVVETQPKGTAEELAKVKDLLATATTSYSSSGANRCGNVERGASLINGTVLYPGDEFSAYNTVSPITVENGYFMAASYSEGEVVESPGGGICQVSTTLYNAALKAELQITQRSNHSMIVSYVDPAKDAAIAGTYKDLKFINNTQAPIYIEGITAGKKITFNIYGMETRDSSRQIEFQSETIEEIEPTTEIKADSSSNFGNISSQSPHKGVVAKLWKIVKENGVEVSRTEVNTSKYSMTPRRYIVGTANALPEALAELQSAIATQDLGTVKSVIGKYGTVATNAVPAADPDAVAQDAPSADSSGQQTTQEQPAAQEQQPQPETQEQPSTAQEQPAAQEQQQPEAQEQQPEGEAAQ